MAWYYSTVDDERWTMTDAVDTAGAIAEGREHHSDGAPFEVAEGTARGPWDMLFRDAGDLAEHIDGLNEDASYEEPFTEEAGLTQADLAPLCDQINALWAAFIEKENPRSNLLQLGKAIQVPAAEGYEIRYTNAAEHGL
ncbi:MAG: hypothetical protein ACREEY_01750 [Brevundimonas sp.]